MLPNLLQQILGSLGGWLVVAVIAVVVLYIVLKIVGKAISTSLRLAIIFGTLVVIAVALFLLRMLLEAGELPLP